MQKSGRPWRRVRGILSAAALSSSIALLLVLHAPVLQAANQDSKGTDFWLMFNENFSSPVLTLFITGDTNTTGTVKALELSSESNAQRKS